MLLIDDMHDWWDGLFEDDDPDDIDPDDVDWDAIESDDDDDDRYYGL